MVEERLNNLRVLITGGLGFIGLHLARALSSICEQIDLMDIVNAKNIDKEAFNFLQRPNVNYIEQDLLNLQKSVRDDYDYIFHFAALLGVENVSLNAYRVLEQNSLTTMAIISQAKKQKKLKKIFFTSTSEVYAGTLYAHGLSFPTEESTPLTISPLPLPRTSYMLSKIYGEGLFNASELPFVILRPHNIYGPRMGVRHVIPQLLEKACKARNEIEVFSPLHTRTFCYVTDAVEYILKLIDLDSVNITLNLGVETPEISMRALAETILHITNTALNIKEMPDTVGSPLRRVPSTQKIKKMTNYEPKISLNEGIKKTYQWYKEHYFEK